MDGTKLSKRQNDMTINSYRQNGIYPEALLNFVASCGGGFLNSKEMNSICIKPLSELVSKVSADYYKLSQLKIMFYLVRRKFDKYKFLSSAFRQTWGI